METNTVFIQKSVMLNDINLEIERLANGMNLPLIIVGKAPMLQKRPIASYFKGLRKARTNVLAFQR